MAVSKSSNTYYLETEEWRRSADENLRKENSWLALAGLFWLNKGETSFGTHISNTIVLASGSGPARMGVFDWTDEEVILRVEEEVELHVDGEIIKERILRPDSSGSPTEITFENLTMMLIEREDGLGIRLWDNQRPERVAFSGRRWYPINDRYLVKGYYETYQEELDLTMSRKNGTDLHQQAQGQVIFQLDGRDHNLVAFEQEDGSLFTLFLDQTSGKESYAAGRYLVINPPKEKMVEIDFNRAYNPPCAFTDFATCPLPPAQNRLGAAIRAGERI